MRSARAARIAALIGALCSATVARADLAQRLDAALAAKALRGAHVGALVVSRADGHALYARDADVPLMPASNQKVLTAVAALATFGPAYRFETDVFADAPPGGDGAVAQLFVRGGGDPLLGSEDFWRIAVAVRAAGVQRVSGDLVVDDSLFDAERVNPDWGAISSRVSYAPIGALTANYATFAVDVRPGPAPGARARTVVDPPLSYFRVSNLVTTSPRGRGGGLRLDREAVAGGEAVTVRGTTRIDAEPRRIAATVTDPGIYAGSVLAWQLQAQGIAIGGGVRRGVTPEGGERLVAYEGRALAEIVRVLMKTSNNPVAETLCKAIGVAAGGAPGSWSRGVEAIGARLRALGIDLSGVNTVDGSGLSHQNRLPARVLVETLRAAGRSFEIGPEFVASLPIAGTDGTLAHRERPIAGEVRAKTGTLADVVSLSGYARLADGGEAVFAVIVNDAPGGDVGARAAADVFAATLVSEAPRTASSEADREATARERTSGAPTRKSSPK